MGHDHSHTHGITATGRHRKRLIAVLAITLAVVLVQVIGAVLSGSLSLLADAGHMLSDAAGVTIALLAAWIAGRPASDQRTYGYQRAEVLAALANALILIVISVVIFSEAIRRIGAAPEVQTDIMLFAAVLGAAANVASLVILRGAHQESLNVRGAYLEVLGDLLGSFAVIAAAVVIMVTGFQAADTIASVLIALLVIYSSWTLIRQSVDVLMEGTPPHIDLGELRTALEALPEVQNIHDLHVWSITSGFVSLSAHLIVDENADAAAVLRSSERLLVDRFRIRHTTIQIDRRPGCDQVHHGAW